MADFPRCDAFLWVHSRIHAGCIRDRQVLEKRPAVREETLESALEKAPDSALQKVSGRTLSRTQGRRERVRTLAAHFIANVAGVLTYYSIGIPYLALILNVYLGQSVSFYRVLQIGLVPFIVPDLVKALVAAVISRALASAGLALSARERGQCLQTPGHSLSHELALRRYVAF